MINKKAEIQADKITDIIFKRLQRDCFTPFDLTEIRDRVCSYELGIEFCESVLNSLKFYQFKSINFWKDVRYIILKNKIIFSERHRETVFDKK